MFRNIIFYDNFANAITGVWKSLFWQGVILLGLGVLILFWPELLQAMVAATFIFLGVVFISLGWKARRVQGQYSVWRDEFWES